MVALDEKKDDLLRLVGRDGSAPANLRLMADRAHLWLLAVELGLDVERVDSGPKGGDLDIGARIVAGDVDAAGFLRDLTCGPTPTSPTSRRC